MYNASYMQQQQQQQAQNGVFAPTDRGAILSGLRRGGQQGYGQPALQHVSIAPTSSGYPMQYNGNGGYAAVQPQQHQPYSAYGQQQQQGPPDVAAMMQQLRLQANRDIEQLRQRTADMTATFMAQQQQEQQRQAFSGAVFSPPMPHGQFQPQHQHGAGPYGYEGQFDRRSGYAGDAFGHNPMASPPMPMRPTFAQASNMVTAAMSTPPTQSVGGFGKVGGGHHRHQSSVGSSGSSVLSAGGILSSPTGPSVILSKPGEPYPAVQQGSPTKAGAVKHVKRDSDASSSGSGSESFDSLNTSVSSGSKAATAVPTSAGVMSPQLRPDAATFSPKIISAPATPPPAMRFGGNGTGQRQPLQLAKRNGANAGQPNALGVAILRQPRGAIASDEPEFAGHNFASQIRKQGRSALGLLSRRTNSPGPVAEDSLQYAQQQLLSQMGVY